MVSSFTTADVSGVTETAARWHDRLSDAPTAHDWRAFEEWRVASPHHAREYARVEAGFATVRSLADDPAMRALRQDVLAGLPASRGTGRKWMAAAGAALLMTGMALVAGYQHGFFEGRQSNLASTVQTFSAGTGQRKEITLEDGSNVMLDARSRIAVSYSAQERRIALLEGQALFTVAKGRPQPFVVSAGNQEITAHGTAFDVRIDPDVIHIALLEGAVEVRDPRRGAMPGIRMKPNDLLTVSGEKVRVGKVSENAGLTSWKEGLLQFDQIPLRQAVAEMNRYLDQPIVVADDRVGDIRISGSFPAGGVTAFAEAVQQSFPIRVTEDSKGRTVLGATD